jgi:hypothetical protein
MKTLVRISLILLMGVANLTVWGQSELNTIPGSLITCYSKTATPSEYKEFKLPTSYKVVEELRQNPNLRTSADRSEIILQFDVSIPQKAKDAFRRAADVWQKYLISNVPIRVFVIWEILTDANGSTRTILGAAGPTTYRRDFDGAERANTWYAVSLAEKLNRQNFNGTEPDIVARFNAGFNWYLEATGLPGNRQEDLMSTVLHEIGHGLGFISSASIGTNTSNQQVGLIGGRGFGGTPIIFDYFIEDKEGKRILDRGAYRTQTTDLYRLYTSGDVYFNSPALKRFNQGERAKLYAPAEYAPSSSISHLDEVLYPAQTPNALMTPFGSSTELTQELGPIVSGMYLDLGYRNGAILHERIKDTENLSSPVKFTAKLVSDTTFSEGSLRLLYSTTGNIKDSVVAKLTKNTQGEFEFLLPADSKERTISYFYNAADARSKLSTPAEAPTVKTHTFKIGKDLSKPTASYAQEQTTITNLVKDLAVNDVTAYDNFGIDSVIVEWQTDGRAKTPIGLKRVGTINTIDNKFGNGFNGAINFATNDLTGVKELRYRILVRDKAQNKNTAILPDSVNYYKVNVLQINPTPLTRYATDFNSSTVANDFVISGDFFINTAQGFASPAVNSKHLYDNGKIDRGDGGNLFSDHILLLNRPVTLRADSSRITFDEVCLVEPAEDGADYFESDSTVNSEFYDYIVVEGSKDGGRTWIPFAPGWNARDKNEWKSVIDRSIKGSGNNAYADGVGTPELFRKREVNLLGNPQFKAGQQVLIRFRMHVDTYFYAWGWTMDNLFIQTAPAKVEVITSSEPLSETNSMKVSPDPSTGEFVVEARFSKAEPKVIVKIHSMNGMEVFEKGYQNSGDTFKTTINTESKVAAGTYVVKVEAGDNVLTRKIRILK